MINKSLLTLGTVISKLSEGVQLAGAPLPLPPQPPSPLLQSLLVAASSHATSYPHGRGRQMWRWSRLRCNVP